MNENVFFIIWCFFLGKTNMKYSVGLMLTIIVKEIINSLCSILSITSISRKQSKGRDG